MISQLVRVGGGKQSPPQDAAWGRWQMRGRDKIRWMPDQVRHDKEERDEPGGA